MAYGIEIKNSSNILQIDETHINFGLVASGTATLDQSTGSFYSTQRKTTITKTGVTYPVIAIHTFGNYVAFTSVEISGGTAEWTFRGYQNNQFIYYIFDIYPESTSGYGLQLFNSAGDVTFNSNYPPMSVKAFNTNTNSLSTGPVYAAFIEAPSYSATATWTGRYISGIGGSSALEYANNQYYRAVKTTSTGAEQTLLNTSSSTSQFPIIEFPDVARKLIVIDVTNMGTQPGASPTYAINPNTTTINEGSSVVFTVTTTNVSNGTTLYWTTAGDVVAADFTDSSLSGSITINNSTATITRTLSNDSTTEGLEDFDLQLRTTSTSGTIVATSPLVEVNDTSTAGISYTITAPTSIDEGSAGTMNVSTTGLTDGTPLYWRVEPSTDFATTEGSINVASNSASFTVTPTADSTTEGAETGTIRLYSDSARTTQVATDTFTINDTSTGPQITSLTSPTSINEGSSGTITVNTSNIPDSTSLNWTINHTTTSAGDFSATSGTVVISSNTGSFSVSPVADSTTEGAETFTVTVSGTVSGTPVSNTTSSITVNDTSTAGETITPGTATISSTTYYGYSGTGDIGSTFGSTTQTTVGGVTLEEFYAFTYTFKSTTYYQVNIKMQGDRSSTSNWSTVKLNGDSNTILNGSSGGVYSSTTNSTAWTYVVTVTAGSTYETYLDLSGNVGTAIDIEWT